MITITKRNILVVEDSKKSQALIAAIIGQCGGVGEIIYAGTVSEANHWALEKDISLFLVDIILDNSKPDDIAGIRFVEKIRAIPKYQFVPVIIITQLYDVAFAAFHNLHCYGYVEKPYDEDKLRLLIESALKIPLANNEEKQFFYYRKDGVLFSIECAEIMYIEAYLRKVNIYLKNDEVSIPYRTIANIIEDIPSSLFVQCHRHTIVNRRFIDNIDKSNRIITLKNGTKIDIGKKYLNGLIY